MNFFALHKKSCYDQRASVFSSRSVFEPGMSNCLSSNIGYQVLYASFFPLLPPPKENIWCISKYILNYILKSDIRSCNAPGSPRSGMSIVKVLKTYNDFQCWNQLSGLATHHANPPLTPITCTDPFMSILEIRSCKPFTVLLFRCWNHILGLVDLSLTRWNQVL